MQMFLIVLISLVVITIIYKILPYREHGLVKPSFAILPKYKTCIEINEADGAIVDYITRSFTQFGFKVSSTNSGIISYSRGHVLGDFSIKLSKVNLTFLQISESAGVLTIAAGWVSAFDTGDHWQLLSELKNKLESARCF